MVDFYCTLDDPEFAGQTFDPIEAALWWQERGLSYTASGYGKKIPTRWKIKINGRLYRIYCAIFSNIGTCYIRKDKNDIIVNQSWR